jgi:hypothetical protein
MAILRMARFEFDMFLNEAWKADWKTAHYSMPVHLKSGKS